MVRDTDIARNLAEVRGRIDDAARRAGRSPTEIKLVAVSKTFPADAVRAAAAAGQRSFGENRVQEGLQKIDAIPDLDLEWHLLGHLQSNKAQRAAAAFSWVESLDSIDLLRKLDAGATAAQRRLNVLIQVDLAHEATKFGVREADVRSLVDAALDASSIALRGLMIVPPIPDVAEDSRVWFRRLRELRDALVAEGRPPAALAELSMGMSQDFEVAVEEGATLVRVGTAIFGARSSP